MSKEHVRLIDANALKKRVVKVMFRDCPESGEFYAVGTDDIDIMPTIDPETLRPKAHWIHKNVYCIAGVAFCSNCGRGIIDGGRLHKYCQNCGARMVNEDE